MLLAIVFAPLIAPHDPYQGSMIRRLRPIGTPNYLLGTDELGRDMLTRLLYGGRLSWFMGITPVALAFVIGTILGVLAGFAGGKVNMADHAHDRRVLRLPLGAAGGRHLRRAGRGHRERHPGADAGLHPADHPRGGERDHRRAQPRFRGCGARLRRLRPSPSCGCMCWATCWGRSSSMPPPDQRLHDHRLGPQLPRPRHQAAGARMGPDAEHAAHGDLRAALGGGAARRLHLRDLASASTCCATGCGRRWM